MCLLHRLSKRALLVNRKKYVHVFFFFFILKKKDNKTSMSVALTEDAEMHRSAKHDAHCMVINNCPFALRQDRNTAWENYLPLLV